MQRKLFSYFFEKQLFCFRKVLDFPKLKLIEENFYFNPFAELERNNTKLVVTDEKGNVKSSNYRILSQKMQKTLKENNNPIELNYKPDFK